MHSQTPTGQRFGNVLFVQGQISRWPLWASLQGQRIVTLMDEGEAWCSTFPKGDPERWRAGVFNSQRKALRTVHTHIPRGSFTT